MYFNDIIGHNSQIQALMRAVRENRVSHSYIFSGTRGIGKKKVALGFAKVLNCLQREPTNDGESETGKCGCRSCRKIEKGIHPDVFLVEYEGVQNIKVDQIREEVENRIALKPYEGKYKVAIVDEAERMNSSAQNAFLKTLEEPPAQSVIILLTSKPSSLLPTILSRCQKLGFNVFSDERLVEEITKRTDLSKDEARIAAKLSGGSLGKALGLNKDILDKRIEIIEQLSTINPDSASAILDLADSLNVKGREQEDTEELRLKLRIISLWLRDLYMVKIGFEPEQLANSDLITVIRKASERWSTDNILNKLSYIEEAWYGIFRANANRQIALENMILKIAQ